MLSALILVGAITFTLVAAYKRLLRGAQAIGIR
jgi:hypothetical protein